MRRAADLARVAVALVAALLANPAAAQSIAHVEGYNALVHVPIGAVASANAAGDSLDGRRFALRTGGAVAGELAGRRAALGVSWIAPRENGTFSVTAGVTGGCEGCARGVMLGAERAWRVRSLLVDTSGAPRAWAGISIEAGIAHAMSTTPMGVRLGGTLSADVTRRVSVNVGPSLALGGYLSPIALAKPEEGRPLSGAIVALLGGGASIGLGGGRRFTLGATHVFVSNARTMLGAAVTW